MSTRLCVSIEGGARETRPVDVELGENEDGARAAFLRQVETAFALPNIAAARVLFADHRDPVERMDLLEEGDALRVQVCDYAPRPTTPVTERRVSASDKRRAGEEENAATTPEKSTTVATPKAPARTGGPMRRGRCKETTTSCFLHEIDALPPRLREALEARVAQMVKGTASGFSYVYARRKRYGWSVMRNLPGQSAWTEIGTVRSPEVGALLRAAFERDPTLHTTKVSNAWLTSMYEANMTADRGARVVEDWLARTSTA